MVVGYPLPCLTRVWWPVYHPCPPMKFFHNNCVGWACRTEILFSSPLLWWIPKSIHQIARFCLKNTKFFSFWPCLSMEPVEDYRFHGLREQHSPHTLACKAKNWGSFSDKSHKNRGHLVSFFPADLGSLSEQFPKFWTVWKKQDFGWQFLVKTGVFGWCKGLK